MKTFFNFLAGRKTEKKSSELAISQFRSLGDEEVFTPEIRELLKCENYTAFSAQFDDLSAVYRPPAFIEPPTNLSKPAFSALVQDDLYAIGCITAEMFLRRPLFNSNSIAAYPDVSLLDELPLQTQHFIRRLIIRDPSEDLTAWDAIHSSVFPSYFPYLYTIFANYHLTHLWTSRLRLIQENWKTLSRLPHEGFLLVFPLVLQLLEQPETRSAAIVQFLSDLLIHLGPRTTSARLRSPIITLYQVSNAELQTELFKLETLSTIYEKFGPDFFIHRILPTLLEALRDKNSTWAADLAAKSLPSISRVLGCVLTTRYVLFPLLKQLRTTSYPHLISTLSAIAATMPASILENQYIPRLFELLQQHSTRATKGHEVAESILQLMKEISVHLDEKTALRVFVENHKQLLVLLLNPPPNPALLRDLAGTLLQISVTIGAPDVKKFILPYFNQFFQNYSDFYENGKPVISRTSSKEKADLLDIYSPDMTYLLYYRFRTLVGGTAMHQEISNWEEIEQVLKQHLLSPSSSLAEARLASERLDLSKKGSGPQSWLGRIRINEPDLPSWSIEGEIVHSFREHTKAVRCITLFHEQYFASGSADNTVKLWDLDSEVSRLTYSEHTQPVHSVAFLDYGSLVASADNALRIWQPDTRQTLIHFAAEMPFVTFRPIRAHTICAANIDNTLRVMDVRTGREMYEWNVAGRQQSAHVRCLGPMRGDRNLAVGTATGVVVSLDQRTGFISDAWKAHESAITKIESVGEHMLATSSTDRTIALWDIRNSPVLVRQFKALPEAPTDICVQDETILACFGTKTTAIGSLGAAQMETFTLRNGKTPLLTVSRLPFHQLVISGDDTGAIVIYH